VTTAAQSRIRSAEGGEAGSRKTLRIAQVIGSFRGGGAQRIAWHLARALDDVALSTAIAVKPDGLAPDAEVLGDRAVQLRAASVLARTRELRRIFERERFDWVHVHGSGTLGLVALALRCMRHPPPLAFTWHDSAEVVGGRWHRRRLIRWALSRCDLLFGSSRDVARRLQDASGKQVRVFPNGVPVRPASHGVASSPPTIVWMGRLVPPKDPQALVRACARLRDEGLAFRVQILGGAPDHLRWFGEQTQSLIDESGLADVVEMAGWVEDPDPVLEGAAIGVQTSHTEGLSLALLEMMMRGLAIVATRVGDTDVAIEHERSGLLVDPQNDDALVEAMRRLIMDSGLRQRLGAAARARAVERFSCEAMARFALRAYADEGAP